jgi:hypothetical protein
MADKKRNRVGRIPSHGQSRRSGRSFEYRVWSGMLSRCRNPNTKGYKYYGAKGVKVCQRWQDSFANFLADMGNSPSRKHSIDRFPNKNGNYEPGNCRWATDVQQSRNMDRVRSITYDGRTMCITEWAEAIGISSKVLTDRLNKLHWPVEKALSTPVRKKYRPKSAA